MNTRTAWRVIALMGVVATGCEKGPEVDSYFRGHGVQVASVPAATEAQMIDASVHAAFDVDPSLILRAHTRRLPRTAGDSGGTPVPPALVRALRERGTIIGTCEPARSVPKGTPRCSGPEAGYIIRTSDVFTVTRDTLELWFSAEKFGPATGQNPDALRFEKIFQLVKDGARWRVAREARVKQ